MVKSNTQIYVVEQGGVRYSEDKGDGIQEGAESRI